MNKIGVVIQKEYSRTKFSTTRTKSSTETVERATRAFECVYDIECSDGLALGMFCVGDRVADDLERTKLVTKAMLIRVNRTDILEEDLEDTTGLIVDKTGDTLHTATTSETADGGFGDTCAARSSQKTVDVESEQRKHTQDVIAQNLSVTLRAALAEALSALSASRHVYLGGGWWLVGLKSSVVMGVVSAGVTSTIRGETD